MTYTDNPHSIAQTDNDARAGTKAWEKSESMQLLTRR